MTAAKFAKYDNNYGYAIFALLASIFMTFSVVIIWLVNRQTVKSSMALTILFLITSSPISLFLFVYFYEDFVGRYFQL